jgi:hypothetical protein
MENLLARKKKSLVQIINNLLGQCKLKLAMEFDIGDEVVC